MPPDYKGQPRDKIGRFTFGRQNGSKSKGRNYSGTAGRAMAGIWDTPPVTSPKPKNPPGQPGDIA